MSAQVQDVVSEQPIDEPTEPIDEFGKEDGKDHFADPSDPNEDDTEDAPDDSDADADASPPPADNSAGVTKTNRPARIAGTAVLTLVIAAALWFATNLLSSGLLLAVIIMLLVVYFVIARKLINPLLEEVSASRTPPTIGPRSVVYNTLSHKLVGVHYVPKLGSAERAQRDLEWAIVVEQTKHRWLTKRVGHVMITVLGYRGGLGKGTTVMNMSLVSWEAHGMPMLVSDSRDTPGNLAHRMGLLTFTNDYPPDYINHVATPTNRQVIERRKKGEFSIPTETWSKLGAMPGTAIFLLASDIQVDETAPAPPPIDVKDFSELMVGDGNSYGGMKDQFISVIHEASNGLNEELDRDLVRISDALVFVHNPTMPSVASGTLLGINAYRNNPDFKEKVERYSALVATEALDTDTPALFARNYAFSPERTFVVVQDPYFAHNANGGKRDDDIDEPVNHFTTDSTEVPEPSIDADAMPLQAKLSYLLVWNSILSALLADREPKYFEEYANFAFDASTEE